MIRDLVLYFLRQGAYNERGDIAVLCAYLGQLQKVRQALKDLKIAVAVDERDDVTAPCRHDTQSRGGQNKTGTSSVLLGSRGYMVVK